MRSSKLLANTEATTTYILELKPESARKIQAQAAQKGVRPEEFLEQLADDVAQSKDERHAEVRAMAEKLFDDRAPVREALAEGVR